MKNSYHCYQCYHLDDIMKFEDSDLGNILLDEKLNDKILNYDVSKITLITAKSLRFRFDKVDGLIRCYDATKCLIVFYFEKYETIYDRIRYLIGLRRGIAYVFSYNHCFRLWFPSRKNVNFV